MKIPLFFALASSAIAATPIVNVPPLDAYSPHTHSAGMLGWTFSVNSPVTVTGVGWFDYGRDGLLSSVQVGLWRDTYTSSGALQHETVWTGNVRADAPLSGDFRALWLQQEITLTPGMYQLGGLHNGIDQGAFVNTGLYDPVSTEDVHVGPFFFYQEPGIFGRADFGPVSQFYLDVGLEMGPMLFIVPEPKSLLLCPLAFLVLLRRSR